MKEARPSFLKNRSKKLLLNEGGGKGGANASMKSKFFLLLFCSQIRSSYFLSGFTS
jgi:hypothetical protein